MTWLVSVGPLDLKAVPLPHLRNSSVDQGLAALLEGSDMLPGAWQASPHSHPPRTPLSIGESSREILDQAVKTATWTKGGVAC